MRLDKMLSHMGLGSRSQVRDVIRKGRVLLNGAVCRDAAQEVDDQCAVQVDGKTVALATAFHLMLHKPSGVVTAAEDPRAKTVMDLLPLKYVQSGCMPVGRLDKDTTGLLILTTDGELAHRLISPKRHVQKVYEAAVKNPLRAEDVQSFQEGIPLKDFTCLPARLDILDANRAQVTVFEGKYHQVKRMFIARDNEVVKLHRRTFGPLELDAELQAGEYRELDEREIALLYDAAGLERKV